MITTSLLAIGLLVLLLIALRLYVGRLKWAVLKTAWAANKFMLITGDATVHIITNYSEKEITHSGNAIYIVPKDKKTMPLPPKKKYP